MKKNYEKNQFILASSFFFFIIVTILLITSMNRNYRIYDVFNTVVTSYNSIELMVNEEEYKQIKRISFIYIDNVKKQVEVQTITRYVLTIEGEHYHHIVLELELSDDHHKKDTIPIVVYGGRQSLFSLLVSSLREENHERN